jgi:hypothetical protein
VVSCVVSDFTVGSQLVQLGRCSELGDSQRRREGINIDIEGSTELEAITRRLLKTRLTEDLVHAVVNCRVCELAIVL